MKIATSTNPEEVTDFVSSKLAKLSLPDDDIEALKPYNYFSTPADLAARLDSGGALPPDLIISLGTQCNKFNFPKSADLNDKYAAVHAETTA